MNHEAIAMHLEQRGLGRRRESIFITEMPLQCRNGALLMDLYSGTPIDHELPGWRDTGFRVIVRAGDYAEGRKLAQRISDALTIRSDYAIPGTGVLMKQCLPWNEPRPYRRSEGSGIWEFEVVVNCKYIQG